MPSTISVLVTPRACWASAVPASATATASTAIPIPRTARPICTLIPGSPFVMRGERGPLPLKLPHPDAASAASFSRVRRVVSSGLGVHGVDEWLVLRVDEGAAELHRRRQLLVLRGQDLLDEAELLDRLDAGQALVDPLDLA